ncbi:MAG: hypothetical protein Tsb0018_08990 [Opitutales bacterium]|tara:strand:- start:1164 stop:1592 length:429 start_codon:yes stop_codon:yes gene_type:complete
MDASLLASAPHSRPKSGVAYCRYMGVGLGFFLIVWGCASWFRWNGALGLGIVQGIFLCLYGLLLTAPWKTVPERTWRRMFFLLLGMTAGFVFFQVFDVLYQAALAEELHHKLAPPAFQGILIFIALMQVPAVLFERKPELLD